MTLFNQYAQILVCPSDRSSLVEVGPEGQLGCPACSTVFPVEGGVVRLLPSEQLGAEGLRQQAAWDDQADDYDTWNQGYADRVEVAPTVTPLAGCAGPVLDLGAGTGRMTERLARLTGQPTLALDYSLASLQRLVRRCEGLPVVAVQADARTLPLADNTIHGAVAAGLVPVLRVEDRRLLLKELARVLRSGAPLSISTLNYNLMYRLWRWRGNAGAKEGEHLHGESYYVRMTPDEFRAELEADFQVESIRGIRNIPGRTLDSALAKVPGVGKVKPLASPMTNYGYRLDLALGATPLSRGTGFLLLAQVRKR